MSTEAAKRKQKDTEEEGGAGSEEGWEEEQSSPRQFSFMSNPEGLDSLCVLSHVGSGVCWEISME